MPIPEKIIEPNHHLHASASKTSKTSSLPTSQLNKKKLYYDEPLPSASNHHHQTTSADSDQDRESEGQVKGWKESGYKIVSEVEYVDKGKVSDFYSSSLRSEKSRDYDFKTESTLYLTFLSNSLLSSFFILCPIPSYSW